MMDSRLHEAPRPNPPLMQRWPRSIGMLSPLLILDDGAYTPLTGFDPLRDQQQQFCPTIDVDFGPDWEFNFGVGIGETHSADYLIVKCIVGPRF